MGKWKSKWYLFYVCQLLIKQSKETIFANKNHLMYSNRDIIDVLKIIKVYLSYLLYFVFTSFHSSIWIVSKSYLSHYLIKMPSSVQFSNSVVSSSLWPYEPQHARPPCPSPTPGVHSNPCPLSWWYHSTMSSSVVPFSFCPQSLPASGSFQMTQLFASGSQSIGVSASTPVRPRNTQVWSPLEWTGWISLQSKGLSRAFSNTTVQKHQLFIAQLSSQSNSHIHTWPLEKP